MTSVLIAGDKNLRILGRAYLKSIMPEAERYFAASLEEVRNLFDHVQSDVYVVGMVSQERKGAANPQASADLVTLLQERKTGWDNIFVIGDEQVIEAVSRMGTERWRAGRLYNTLGSNTYINFLRDLTEKLRSIP